MPSKNFQHVGQAVDPEHLRQRHKSNEAQKPRIDASAQLDEIDHFFDLIDQPTMPRSYALVKRAEKDEQPIDLDFIFGPPRKRPTPFAFVHGEWAFGTLAWRPRHGSGQSRLTVYNQRLYIGGVKPTKPDPIATLKTKLAELDKEGADIQRRIAFGQQSVQTLVNKHIGIEHSREAFTALLTELEKPDAAQVPVP